MSEWSLIKIEDVVLSANTGLDAIKRAPIVDRNTGIRCLRIQDVSQRKSYNDWGFTDVEVRNFNKFQLKKNDILIARTGASIGVNLLIKETLNSVFNNGLIRIRTKETMCNPTFLYYNFRSNEYNGYIESISGGTSTQPNMQIGALLKYEVYLPSLPEQRSIANILSSLDDKIDLLHRQNATLEKLAETLFRQWFVEEAKEDWEEGFLSDLVIVKYGKDHKNLECGDIPVFGSGGIMRYANRALYDKETVLIPRKGTLNNVMYVYEPFWTVDTMFYTEMKRPNIAKFVFQFVNTLDLASMNVGSAVPSMTTEVLNNIPISIPPDILFEQFENTIEPFYKKIKNNTIQIRTLTSIRDTLLPKLMSGEVRVKES